MPVTAGTFELSMTPNKRTDQIDEFLLEKRFEGSLSGSGRGTMLAFTTEVQGSASYVAMEHIDGTLDGKAGGFALFHASRMVRGVIDPSIRIVPDSGTGDLTGISGSMTLTKDDGQHSYEIDYELSD